MPANVTLQQLPEWYNKAWQDIAARATELSKRPYYKPTESLFNPLRAEYEHLLKGLNGKGLQKDKFSPYETDAKSFLKSSAAEFNPDQIKRRYLNPYLEGELARISNLAGERLREQLLPDLASRYIGMGRFGGLSHQQAMEKVTRDITRAATGQQNELLHNAWGQALNQHNMQGQMQRQAAEGLSSLGRTAQGSHLADLETERSLEAQFQDLGQQERHYNRQQFEHERNYPWQQLAQESAAIQGMPVPGMTTFQHNFPAPPPPQLNAMGQVGAMAGQLLGLNQMGQGRKRGGLISSMRTMPRISRRKPIHPALLPPVKPIKSIKPPKLSFGGVK